MRKYPIAKIKDVEEVVEKMAQDNEGRVDIEEFIGLLRSRPPVVPSTPESRAVLAIKAQRMLLPSDYMNYYSKISVSNLYTLPVITSLHEHQQNLPSDSFKFVRDDLGVWYRDIRPIKDTADKPTGCMQYIEPTHAGYLILARATGVPIQSASSVKRENVVNRVVKVCLLDGERGSVVHGSAFVQAEWDKESEHVWNFNPVGKAGTNPLVFKWVNEEVKVDAGPSSEQPANSQPNNPSFDSVRKIEILFELVSTVR